MRGGGPGQFGKSSDLDFFFWKASLICFMNKHLETNFKGKFWIFVGFQSFFIFEELFFVSQNHISTKVNVASSAGPISLWPFSAQLNAEGFSRGEAKPALGIEIVLSEIFLVFYFRVKTGCNCLAKVYVTTGKKLFLAKNSEIIISAISSVFEGNLLLLKKGMHWFGPGSKIGLNEK